MAQANEIQLLIGIYHQTYGSRMTVDNARPWAAWVTNRYREYPNIIWTVYPKATDSYRPIVRQLAAGIQEGDRGRHLVSIHPDPSPASSSFMHGEPWLGFNSIQVWNQIRSIYPMTLADYERTPSRPVTMLEGAYEAGEEYGYPITPLLVRRQAYYTCLAGGFHGYGHNDAWRVKPRWREALDDPGAQQMTILKNALTGLPDWWTLVPDQDRVELGRQYEGRCAQPRRPIHRRQMDHRLHRRPAGHHRRPGQDHRCRLGDCEMDQSGHGLSRGDWHVPRPQAAIIHEARRLAGCAARGNSRHLRPRSVNLPGSSGCSGSLAECRTPFHSRHSLLPMVRPEIRLPRTKTVLPAQALRQKTAFEEVEVRRAVAVRRPECGEGHGRPALWMRDFHTRPGMNQIGI